MSSATIQNVSTIAVSVADPASVSAAHEKAVAEIVGLVRAKYEDEGVRNFAIGKRAFEHATWQRGNFTDPITRASKYEGLDFDNLMNRVRDDVRVWVAISPKSIKLGEWVRCYVLKAKVAEAIGADKANAVSFFEYRSSYSEALSFSKTELFGEIKPGWLDLYRGVAADRAKGQRVSSDDFMGRIAANVKRLAALAVTADPVAAAAKVVSDAVKAKTRAVSKSNEDITASVSDALVSGNVSPEGVLAIVESVAKAHDVVLPTRFGFDPSTATVAECKLLAETMYAAGRFEEIRSLAGVLNKMVATLDHGIAAKDEKITRKAARLAKTGA